MGVPMAEIANAAGTVITHLVGDCTEVTTIDNATIPRHVALDVLENVFNPDDHRVRAARRAGLIEAFDGNQPDGFPWQKVARMFGVSMEAIEHFLRDWPDHDEVIVGCMSALRQAGPGMDIRYSQVYAGVVHVTWAVVDGVMRVAILGPWVSQ